MAKRKAQRRDPLDGIIESALQPGDFIDWNETDSFVSELRDVENQIAKVAAVDPSRGVALYETFIAGCTLRAEELDDSDGEFGTFAGELYCGWIKARQAAGTDREQTAKLLLAWMDDDDYGFCNDLERSAATVLDRAGLEAFEREVLARFDNACAALSTGKGSAAANPNYARDRWGGILKSIYSKRRNIEKYLDLTARAGLTQVDCEAIATMFQAKRKLKDALAWLEKGIQMDKPEGGFQRGESYKLPEMRRALLVKLGRGHEALHSAWTEFQADPNKFTYHELIRYVPKTERAEWHEMAMAASERGELDSLIELWLGAKEIDRLAARLGSAPDTQLERLSHYVTEPAAQRLAKTHPGVAARIFRALCVRIINAGKSKYYVEALSNLEESRKCYQQAGLDDQWKALVAEIRLDHRRKSGFMPGFEAIVAGKRSQAEPSFLDRARSRWATKTEA